VASTDSRWSSEPDSPLALGKIGTESPNFCNSAAASITMVLLMAAPAMVVVGPIRCGLPAKSSAASPSGAQLSITRSAISNKRLPENVARTGTHRLLNVGNGNHHQAADTCISSAISMGTAFLPEFEAIIATSVG
jgi:hypothetical protein